MINAISAADIAFIMSSAMTAWLLSPLECSQKQITESFASVSEDELCEKCIIKQLLKFGFCMISCSTSSNNSLVITCYFSMSAWLLSPLECSQKQMVECFASVSEDELCEKLIIKQLLNSVFV